MHVVENGDIYKNRQKNYLYSQCLVMISLHIL